MTEERCKELMTRFGMPDNQSLMILLYQVANETEQEVRNELKVKEAAGSSCHTCTDLEECFVPYKKTDCPSYNKKGSPLAETLFVDPANGDFTIASSGKDSRKVRQYGGINK